MHPLIDVENLRRTTHPEQISTETCRWVPLTCRSMHLLPGSLCKINCLGVGGDDTLAKTLRTLCHFSVSKKQRIDFLAVSVNPKWSVDCEQSLCFSIVDNKGEPKSASAKRKRAEGNSCSLTSAHPNFRSLALRACSQEKDGLLAF